MTYELNWDFYIEIQKEIPEVLQTDFMTLWLQIADIQRSICINVKECRRKKIQGVPEKRSRFWKRLIVMFLMIDSSNFQELSLTLSDFVTWLCFWCPMSGLYLAYSRTKMRKFRKLYKLYEYMPTLDVFCIRW